MKTTLVSLAILGASALAVSASAEYDTDGDGLFSLPELQAVYPDMTAEMYAALDSNADGLIDEAELTAAQESGVLPAAG
ncbi:MAG: EF-hand domain-containing protein [Pseudomonadota bacterium]